MGPLPLPKYLPALPRFCPPAHAPCSTREVAPSLTSSKRIQTNSWVAMARRILEVRRWHFWWHWLEGIWEFCLCRIIDLAGREVGYHCPLEERSIIPGVLFNPRQLEEFFFIFITIIILFFFFGGALWSRLL